MSNQFNLFFIFERKLRYPENIDSEAIPWPSMFPEIAIVIIYINITTYNGVPECRPLNVTLRFC